MNTAEAVVMCVFLVCGFGTLAFMVWLDSKGGPVIVDDGDDDE